MTKYFLLLLVPFLGLAQKQTFDQRLFDSYEDFKAQQGGGRSQRG